MHRHAGACISAGLVQVLYGSGVGYAAKPCNILHLQYAPVGIGKAAPCHDQTVTA